MRPKRKDQSEKPDHQEKRKEKEEKDKKSKLRKENNTMIVLQEEKTMAKPTIEILIEEETMVKLDLQEESNKDMNPEEKNTEKELQFNGLKLMKSAQEMTDSTLSSR